MSEHLTEAVDRTTTTAFAVAVFIGGSNFVAVKFSNSELAPLYGAALRFAAAALILFGIAKLRRMELPKGRALSGAGLYGVLNFAVGYALMYVALLGISAGTTSVMLASVPLLTLVLAVLHRQERFTIQGIVGGLFAVAGITVMSLHSLGADLPVVSLLAAFGGALAFAESGVLVKGFPAAHPITTNAIGMAAGSTVLFIGSAVANEEWVLPGSARTWMVLAWLAVAGSVGLFGLFVFVIKRWTASATAYAITLMPVVAVSMGAVLADETITPEVVVGAALVASGVYVGALSSRRLRAREPRPLERMVSEEEAYA